MNDKKLKEQIEKLDDREIQEKILFQLMSIKKSVSNTAMVVTTILVFMVIGFIIALFS